MINQNKKYRNSLCEILKTAGVVLSRTVESSLEITFNINISSGDNTCSSVPSSQQVSSDFFGDINDFYINSGTFLLIAFLIIMGVFLTYMASFLS